MMERERLQQIEQLYHTSLEWEESKRLEFLAAACEGDPDLLREVESLLALETQPHGFLDERALDVVARVFANDQTQEGEERLSGDDASEGRELIGSQVGPYLITALIGAGGMGRVFQARDNQLNRTVAIKTLAAGHFGNFERAKRFLREAKAASAMNHPNIVTIHALIEHGGATFIVMEYICGKTLDNLIPQNGMTLAQTVRYGLEIADALTAAHAAGVVHRDIKPSNIMITAHDRVKVLDFGLAKAAENSRGVAWAAVTAEAPNTNQGLVFGTPAYMSPEQARGEIVDARSDLFSLGTVLYQMATGKLPFEGKTAAAILASLLRDQPEYPARIQPTVSLELQDIIMKALEKNRESRYGSAADLYSDLKRLDRGTYSQATAIPRRVESPDARHQNDASESRRNLSHPRVVRFLAFPFRVDPVLAESGYLVYGLPEAIASSLAELNAFTVRSTQTAMRFDPVRWDPKTVAAEADVDVILTGTLTRGKGNIRALTQLIEGTTGTVTWSKTWDLDLEDAFRFVQGVVQLIAGTLVQGRGDQEQIAAGVDRPANHEGYELYLRANQLALTRTPGNIALARDLYLASTEKDPSYAPAWAQLGRCHRFLAKFGMERVRDLEAAQACLQRAFALNPDLAIAHNLYTPIQVDRGEAEAAMVRLVKRACVHQNDAELFSGLVHACRYCGQLEESLAAHDRALYLDRNIRTSVAHTYFAIGDYERALYWYGSRGAGLYLDALALASMGRNDDAAALLWTRKDQFHLMPVAMHSLQAYLNEDYATGIALLERTLSCDSELSDSEMRFYMARQAAKFGASGLANELLLRTVEEGYFCSRALMRDSWFEPLRSTAAYATTLDMVKTLEAHARTAFRDAGGERIYSS